MRQGLNAARGGALRKAALLCALMAAVWASAAPSAGAACPNEAFRSEQGATALPACMAYEMVSPPAKALQPAYWPAFSLNGDRVQYRSLAALANTPGYQLFKGDSYIASRTASGWATAPTSPPAAYAIFTGPEKGGPFAFSPDLGGWALAGATAAQAAAGVAQVFRGSLGGAFEPISPLIVGIDNTQNKDFQFSVNNYTGTATAEDLSTTVIRVNFSSISLVPGDPSGQSYPSQEPGGDRNSYVAYRDGSGATHLELLARAGDGTVYGGRCGAHTGGEVLGPAAFPKVYEGAISPEGSRIFFSTRPDQPYDELNQEGPPCDTAANGLRVMQRVESVPGQAEITPISPELPKGAGDDLYQAASRDGAKVYFASPRKLAPADADASPQQCGDGLGASKGCDLYLYDASLPPGERVVQASAGGAGDPTPGTGANVLSLATAISGDGSHAYFVAQGVLTTDPNPEGDLATAGQPNLYLYERNAAHPSGRTAFLGALDPGDKGELWGAQGSFFGSASAVPFHGGAAGGDGHVLFLASKAPLTADDLDGGHRDLFRYDAEELTLERVSKPNPGSGGADDGLFDVTVNPSRPVGFAQASNFEERARWAGDDGETVAFLTAEALDPADEDGAANPYLLKEGELARVPALAEDPPAVSPPGGAIAFSTPTALLPKVDRDLVKDIYVLRASGGFPPPTEDFPDCGPPSCQPPPPPPPPLSANGTAGAIRGEEAIPVKCKKGFVKKKGKCVKKHKHKKAHKDKGGSR